MLMKYSRAKRRGMNDKGCFTLMGMTGASPTLAQEPIMQMVHLKKVLGGSGSALTARQSLSASP